MCIVICRRVFSNILSRLELNAGALQQSDSLLHLCIPQLFPYEDNMLMLKRKSAARILDLRLYCFNQKYYVKKCTFSFIPRSIYNRVKHPLRETIK